MTTIRKNAKFSTEFAEVALRLKAAGFNDDDLAYALGVTRVTINRWQGQYPFFKQAVQEGRSVAVKHLVATAIRAACGYDYEEIDEEKALDGTVKKTLVKKKHQKPDSYLLTFMLINLAPEQFRNTKYLIEEKKALNIDVSAQLEADQIERLSGKLVSMAKELSEKKKVEAVSVGQS